MLVPRVPHERMSASELQPKRSPLCSKSSSAGHASTGSVRTTSYKINDQEERAVASQAAAVPLFRRNITRQPKERTLMPKKAALSSGFKSVLMRTVAVEETCVSCVMSTRVMASLMFSRHRLPAAG